MNRNLFDSYLESMNFLNEVSINYPSAISFASGRPYKDFFNVESAISGIKSYVKANKPEKQSTDEFFNHLGQYNKTKGIINESISRLIYNDEQIAANPEDIIMTDGAQEGMAIIINTLFSSPDDVLLVSDPSYIGFIGYAKIAGIPIHAIHRNNSSTDLDHLENTIQELLKRGKKPRAIYEVPDFHNPTGSYMPLNARKRIIELAEKYDFYIIEDNPYGYFIYDVEKIPTLKALDRYKRVIYLGSFAKTIFPSLRLGYLLVDQKIKSGNKVYNLVDECKKVKSFITVNTSTLLQAMAGSILQQENYSLKSFCRLKVEYCKKNRDAMVNAVKHFFGSDQEWQRPAGGFFMMMDIPFPISDNQILECAEKHSVIFCPMYMFYLDKTKGANQIRLAFSNLTTDEIELGIERLAGFLIKKNAWRNISCLR
ncbi:MAG: PLP-dependent aminotransferase family protein [Ruminiclostridium sp.]|nr:PLP-dependent aminotransferase family protein [Ruminiclostridium sp.]